ncbi:Hint domain-containing protein [Paracoccus caeni]|uniref:Hint domain-containing protein n=1 Tax=Paracoccus caeni TaxID=657651 RepID=A0A934SBR8_9RHOB|nr:Hint domain-containing protein [Paracoccus caeni]MBK4215901.1 Hint domain-containing protein [Paracoccus caeni]
MPFESDAEDADRGRLLAAGYLDARIAGVQVRYPVILVGADDQQFLVYPDAPEDILSVLPEAKQTHLHLFENAQYDPQNDSVPCFCSGTLIGTINGDMPIETLKPGDMVATRDHGYQPIRWIGSKHLSQARLNRNPDLLPIRIRAGALGRNLPASDLLISPKHRVLVRSVIAQRMFGAFEILVAARQLLSIEGIAIADDLTEVTYFHILFDQHEVVVSNGAETESLFTGPDAMKSVGLAAQTEIFAILPELAKKSYRPSPSRPIPTGRMADQLAARHLMHQRPLFS